MAGLVLVGLAARPQEATLAGCRCLQMQVCHASKAMAGLEWWTQSPMQPRDGAAMKPSICCTGHLLN